MTLTRQPKLAVDRFPVASVRRLWAFVELPNCGTVNGGLPRCRWAVDRGQWTVNCLI